MNWKNTESSTDRIERIYLILITWAEVQYFVITCSKAYIFSLPVFHIRPCFALVRLRFELCCQPPCAVCRNLTPTSSTTKFMFASHMTVTLLWIELWRPPSSVSLLYYNLYCIEINCHCRYISCSSHINLLNVLGYVVTARLTNIVVCVSALIKDVTSVRVGKCKRMNSVFSI